MDVIPKEIMSELYIRFQQDLEDFKNIFANIEIMYWFYLDQFYVIGNLPNVDLIDFTTQFFNQFNRIIPAGFIWEQEFDRWKAKKSKTPTASAIIMDTSFEMVIMVKGFSSKRWTFPGGKKETESFKDCAIREVDEEIGFDISNNIDDDLVISVERDGVRRFHYIICGVSLDTPFRPKTNCEIEKITWFPLVHLPESKLDNCLQTINARAKDFLAAMHVIKIIKRWVSLFKEHGKAEALKIATQQIEQEEAKLTKPRSKSVSDSKETVKKPQISNALITKNKMLSYPKRWPVTISDMPWTGILFNKEEFCNELYRQLHLQR